MSRPLRIEYPGAWYHVMNRGLNRRSTYSDSQDYSLFLQTLGEACFLFHVSVSAYCLMPNHYHLLIHTPEGNLSRFMRHLNGVYTQRFNRAHNRDGPLFRGRFKGILVQQDSHLIQVVQYIHHNPIKARLVESLKEYKWSSHRHFLKAGDRPEWLGTDFILGQFSSRRTRAISLYRDFMLRTPDEKVSKFYSKKYWDPVLGDDSFVERIKKKYIGADKTLDMEIKGKRLLRGRESVRRINGEVCLLFKVPKSELHASRRGTENIPRKMAILLARELSGLSLGELATEYKAKTYKAIATSCHRLQTALGKDRKLTRQYDRLKKICSQEEI